MADKPEPHPTDDARPAPKAKTFGEALDEMGCVPLDPPRRIILRRGRPRKRLMLWRKSEEQD